MHIVDLPLTADLRPLIEFDSCVRRRFASSAQWVDEVLYTTNAWGWRGNKDVIIKSNCKKRILVIGDSFAENYKKDWSKSIPAVIENLLNKHFECEVLSIGMRGFNLLDYYKLVQYESNRFQPDLIIILVFTFNDFKPHLLRVCKHLGDDIIFTNLSESQKEFDLYIDAPDCRITKMQLARAIEEKRITTRTCLGNVIQYSLRLLPVEFLAMERKRLINKLSGRNNYLTRVLAPGLQVYETNPDVDMKSVWVLVKQILQLMAEKNESNRPLMLVALSNAEQIYPGILDTEVGFISSDIRKYSIAYPDDLLLSYCIDLGLEFLSTYKNFKNYSNIDLFDNVNSNNPRIYKGNWWGHYTNSGNFIMAKIIADAVISRNLL